MASELTMTERVKEIRERQKVAHKCRNLDTSIGTVATQYARDVGFLLNTVERLLAGQTNQLLLLNELAWNVHCGKYHQWKTIEQCTQEPCFKFKKVVAEAEAALGEGTEEPVPLVDREARR